MLSNAYFLAKIRFDTAKNEPAKKLQKNSKIARTNSARRDLLERRVGLAEEVRVEVGVEPVQRFVERFDIEPFPDFSAK